MVSRYKPMWWQMAVAGLLLFCAFSLFARTLDDSVVPLQDLSTSLASISRATAPAVVTIVASGYGPVGSPFGGPSLFSKQHSGGSGVLVDSAGYVVTNAHVVAGARSIQVILHTESAVDRPGKSILRSEGKTVGAQLVGLDTETDLAVLKIEANGLAYLDIGDSDELHPGDIVLAFGSPLGLENSVSLGIVSATARQLEPEDPMIYIQTDASINPGNSGGPLVDTYGRLVGINTMIFSQSGGNEGIGFAAPGNIVRTVFENIRDYGYVRRGEIGVHAQTITPTLAEALGLDRNWGVIIGDVFPGSPAETAGLLIGDIVLRIGGKTMENGRQFDVNVYRRNVGDAAVLEILREGQPLTIRVPVVERSDDPDRFVSMVTAEHNLVPELGLLCLEIDSRVRRMMPELRNPEGILVAALSPEGLYINSGLAAGDVVLSFNGTPVRSLQEFKDMVASLNPSIPTAVQIQRGPQLQYLTFELR